MSKINIKRPHTGFVKLEVTHNGTGAIRSNLRSSLLGTAGESQHHIVSIAELGGSINHSCLSQSDIPLFTVIGRNRAPIRVLNVFNDDAFYLGTRVQAPVAGVYPGSEDNGAVEYIPEDEFRLFVPSQVYSVRDLVWRIGKKIDRISSILKLNGTQDFTLPQGPTPGDDGNGNIPTGAVGDAVGYSVVPIILKSLPYDATPLLKFTFTAGGNIGFDAIPSFWNRFAIHCSPYFRALTGFPELICFTDDTFGEDISTQAIPEPNPGFWKEGRNTENHNKQSPKNLFISGEERDTVLCTSDIPIPAERNIENGQSKLRYVFAHFDIYGQHQHEFGRAFTSYQTTSEWYLEGPNIVGNIIMDPPQDTGYCSLVLPSIIPSINIRAFLRRKQFNFETNEYSMVEVPLLKDSIDYLVLRMNFTLQM